MKHPASLVFGATGYIGSNLVPALLDRGIPVRAVGRDLERLRARRWQGAALAEADALVPDSLPPVLEGIEVAYYLVHSMAAGRDFGELDRRAAANFADAAEAAGVRQIVYLGGLVPEDADSEHIVSRKETGEILRRGAVPVTELRAGIIVGAGSAAFEVMRDLVFHLPLMITPRWVRAQSPPIALDDLIEILVRIPEVAEARGQVLDAAGPEDLDYTRMMRILAELAGRRKPLIIPVPWLSPRLSSYWLRLVTSVPTPVARALVEGLRHDFHADREPLQRLLALEPMGFRPAVQRAFAAEEQAEVQSRWVEGAFAMRQYRRDYAFYARRSGAELNTEARPAAVWKTISRIGGKTRYFGHDLLWTLRETADWLIGGPGRRYGRRDPDTLRLGDVVDSWRVVGLEEERRLTLQFGMKAPGAGILEFELKPLENGGTQLKATAYWHPAGVWGLLYWAVLVPFHDRIFKRMVQEIARRAETASAP